MTDEPIDVEEAYDSFKRIFPLHKGPDKRRRFLGWICLSELRIGVVLFILCALTVCSLNFIFEIEAKDVIVEANGLILDLVLFGCLITWLNKRRSFKEQIRGYQETLTDLSSWRSEEGVLKKVGIIKRLEDIAGVEALRGLDYCELPHANFQGVNLKGVGFNFANLSNAFLNGTYFKGSNLAGADLSNSCIASAYLVDADLRGTDLRGADFEFADLTGAKFGIYTVGQLSSQGPSTYVTDLRGAVRLTPEQLMSAVGWENALRDQELACGKPIPIVGSADRA